MRVHLEAYTMNRDNHHCEGIRIVYNEYLVITRWAFELALDNRVDILLWIIESGKLYK